MEDTILRFIARVAISLLFIPLGVVIAGGGAVAGWVIGLFFGDTIAEFTTYEPWKIGMMAAFVGMFFTPAVVPIPKD